MLKESSQKSCWQGRNLQERSGQPPLDIKVSSREEKGPRVFELARNSPFFSYMRSTRLTVWKLACDAGSFTAWTQNALAYSPKRERSCRKGFGTCADERGGVRAVVITTAQPQQHLQRIEKVHFNLPACSLPSALLSSVSDCSRQSKQPNRKLKLLVCSLNFLPPGVLDTFRGTKRFFVGPSASLLRFCGDRSRASQVTRKVPPHLVVVRGSWVGGSSLAQELQGVRIGTSASFASTVGQFCELLCFYVGNEAWEHRDDDTRVQ